MSDINKAYTWAIQTCNAPNVGYSQAYRNQQTVRGVTYYDCSSFINYALLAGGFSTPAYAPGRNAFTTTSMIGELTRLGFSEVNASGEYKAGDIGWVSGHTEMCYRGGIGKGVFMGAHTNSAPLENQVSIGSSGGNPNYERSFTRLFRYGGGGGGEPGEGAVNTGSSAFVVAALAGNAWRESHINPSIGQIGGTAFGLFQWDGVRQENLLQWMSDNGYQWTDPVGQMMYLVVENDWQGSHDGISSLTEFLNSTSTNIASLTEAFCLCWERPGVPAMQERITFAVEAFDFIVAHANDPTINFWYTTPSLLERWQAYNNAVMMYRFYSSGGGGGGSKRKTPAWKKIRYLRWG